MKLEVYGFSAFLILAATACSSMTWTEFASVASPIGKIALLRWPMLDDTKFKAVVVRGGANIVVQESVRGNAARVGVMYSAEKEFIAVVACHTFAEVSASGIDAKTGRHLTADEIVDLLHLRTAVPDARGFTTYLSRSCSEGRRLPGEIAQ